VYLNPGIMLHQHEDGTVTVVASITCKSSNASSSRNALRVIKLSSKLLLYDRWINVSIRLISVIPENEKSSSPEKKLFELYIDHSLHASSIDTFGK
jgi:hypothetical protein